MRTFKESKSRQKKETKKNNRRSKRTPNNKMAEGSPNVLMIAFNVNSQNIPIKRQRLLDWMKT